MQIRMSKLLMFVVFSAVTLCPCEGFRMTRCELVEQLRKYGFPEKDMRDWVCLVENESDRQTDVISRPNKNGSRDYGLFQINNGWWCSNTTVPGKGCDVTCAELVTDDITKAAECAKYIFTRQGFRAWHGWENRCQKDLPDISNCVKSPYRTALTVINSITSSLGWI